jgi:hypothetical protein
LEEQPTMDKENIQPINAAQANKSIRTKMVHALT